MVTCSARNHRFMTKTHRNKYDMSIVMHIKYFTTSVNISQVFLGSQWCSRSPNPFEISEVLIFSSFQEWANTMARRPPSVCLSVCLSVCKLLRKSLLLADKWPDRDQTFTRWTPGQRASTVCSRSKVTWYVHFLGFLEWATPSLTVWLYIGWLCQLPTVPNAELTYIIDVC